MKRKPNKTPTNTHCLTNGCQRKVLRRGLCSSCYQTATVLIRNGQMDWRTLEKNGKALPPQKNGRTPHLRNWFLGIQQPQ